LLTQAFKFYEERFTLKTGKKVRQNDGFSQNPRAVPWNSTGRARTLFVTKYYKKSVNPQPNGEP
jgi:hypothetical protein